jgi:GTP1/Obg family GTP-binding protein
MILSKRDQAHIERRLVATLTEACETAKAEIAGFSWLTHEVDYGKFPASLMVVWVFDTQANMDQALAKGQGERMVVLTASALRDADVFVSPVSAHVYFDSEEQCQRANAGNWQQRLARKRSTRG